MPKPDKTDTVPTRDAGNELLFWELVRTASLFRREAEAVLRISAVQAGILDLLAAKEEDGISFLKLVETFSVSRQNLDGILKRMERAGLIERTVDPCDRRARFVRLTGIGRDARKAQTPWTMELYRQASALLRDDQVEGIIAALQAIRSSLGKISIDIPEATLAKWAVVGG